MARGEPVEIVDNTVTELDLSPVEVRGSGRAVKARVIVKDGNLYVARGSENVTVYEGAAVTLTDPRRHQYGADNGLTFYRRGCGSCGYTLGRVSAADLIARAVPPSEPSA